MYPKTMHDTCHVIIKIRNPPEPQKVWFYLGKTHIFENLTGPLKLTKMTPKWTQKEPKGTSKASKGPPRRSKGTVENFIKKMTC